jgi:hypothetical protein
VSLLVCLLLPRLVVAPQAWVPVGRLADEAGLGGGISARAGWDFDLDDFFAVPELALGAGHFGASSGGHAVNAIIAGGGLRLALHKPPVLTSLMLHLGHGWLYPDGPDRRHGGLSLDVGASIAWAPTRGLALGAEVSELQVFTDPGGALGRAARRWLAFGLNVGVDL